MIRFRCRECDKKLKAEPSIIGRKVKCTQCGNIEKVPPQDRLERRFAQGTSPAESDDDLIRADSDSFDFLFNKNNRRVERNLIPDVGSEDESLLATRDVAFGGNGADNRLATKEPELDHRFGMSFSQQENGATQTANKQSESLRPLDPTSDETWNEIVTSPENIGRKFAKKKKSQLTSQLLGIGIGLIGLVAVGFTLMLLTGFFVQPAKYDDQFEQITEVVHYREAKLQLEKAGRWMKVMGETYMRIAEDKKEISAEIEAMQDSIDDLTVNSNVLDRAFELFRKEEVSAAKKLVNSATQEMEARRLEIQDRTDVYRGRKSGT